MVLTLLDFRDWLHEIVKAEMVVRHARQSNQLGAKNKEVKKDHPKVLSVTTSGSEALKSPVKTEKTHGKVHFVEKIIDWVYAKPLLRRTRKSE